MASSKSKDINNGKVEKRKVSKIDHSDRKSSNELIKKLLTLEPAKEKNKNVTKEKPSTSKDERKTSTNFSPIHRRLRKRNIAPQSSTLSSWISPITVKQEAKGKIKKLKTIKDITDQNKNKEKSKQMSKVKSKEKSKSKCTTNEKPSKPLFSRSESSESCSSELPMFDKKTSSKRSKKDDSYEKYGITLPSFKEILKEKLAFDKYKSQIESVENFENCSLRLPDSFTDLNATNTKNENLLDCKYLTIKEIKKKFKENFQYISDIFDGTTYSERHNRYHNYLPSYDLTNKALTCNTSTVVFTFEQIDHLINLMQKKFDPENKLTPYFFQVLLPELCLKIFMDIHNMSRNEAVSYLDTRPIVN